MIFSMWEDFFCSRINVNLNFTEIVVIFVLRKKIKKVLHLKYVAALWKVFSIADGCPSELKRKSSLKG